MTRLIRITDVQEDEDDPLELDRETLALAKGFLQHAVNGTNHWDDDPNLLRTPERFARMIRELTTSDEFEFTTFPNNMTHNEMVVQKDIHFVSLCSHHIIPFIGVAHVAYIPDQLIVGLSKLARTVRYWAAGLWTQEDLTYRIVNVLEEQLDPQGVAIVMEAEHLCMSIRGIQAPGTKTITSAIRGVFLDPAPGRDPKGEFLRLIGAV